MDSIDLDNAAERAAQEEAKYKDIYAGEVRCGSEILFFERVSLYENRLSVMLPKSYKDLPKALAKMKYPMENRPAVIKTNADTTVNIAFAYHKQAFSEAQVESAAKGLKEGLARMTPGARFLDTRILKTLEGIKFSCFEFFSTGLDAEAYHLFGFVPVHGQFLHFIFNAPAELARTWQPVALQVCESVREIDKENDLKGR